MRNRKSSQYDQNERLEIQNCRKVLLIREDINRGYAMEKYSGKVTTELKEIYQKAYEEGIWLREAVLGTKKNYYSAAAGSMETITELEKKLGKEIEIMQLELGDLVDLSVPGYGKTREEACKNAIKELKKYQKMRS